MSAVRKPNDGGRYVENGSRAEKLARAASEARNAQDSAKRSSLPPTPPPTSDRAKLVHNEQTKLTANLLNGIALAFIVGGGVTTFTSMGAPLDPGGLMLRSIVWILTGSVLHIYARSLLRNLL